MTTRAGSGDTATFLSVFSGCGGFDAGLVEAGFRCLGAYDIDPVALAVHRRNLDGPTTVCDLRVGLPKGQAIPRADLLVAGSPCQGFSTIGLRRIDDPRNELLITAGQIALAVRPPVFVAENVAAVMSGGHRRYWERLVRMLRAVGYRTAQLSIRAESVGLPQIRKRMLLVAWWRGRDGRLVLRDRPRRTLRDTLAGVEATANHSPRRLRAGSVGALIAAHIRPGQKLSNVRASARAVHTWQVPKVFGPTTARERLVLQTLLRERRRNRLRASGDADPVTLSTLRRSLGSEVDEALPNLVRKHYVRKVGRRYDLTHTFNGKYRRLSWDEPAPTVDTKFGDPRLFLHPSQRRGLSVREAARIQGFCDEFVFDGSRRDQYRMVGNAVPPPVAAAIGSWIRGTLL